MTSTNIKKAEQKRAKRKRERLAAANGDVQAIQRRATERERIEERCSQRTYEKKKKDCKSKWMHTPVVLNPQQPVFKATSEMQNVSRTLQVEPSDERILISPVSPKKPTQFTIWNIRSKNKCDMYDCQMTKYKEALTVYRAEYESYRKQYKQLAVHSTAQTKTTLGCARRKLFNCSDLL